DPLDLGVVLEITPERQVAGSGHVAEQLGDRDLLRRVRSGGLTDRLGELEPVEFLVAEVTTLADPVGLGALVDLDGGGESDARAAHGELTPTAGCGATATIAVVGATVATLSVVGAVTIAGALTLAVAALTRGGRLGLRSGGGSGSGLLGSSVGSLGL